MTGRLRKGVLVKGLPGNAEQCSSGSGGGRVMEGAQSGACKGMRHKMTWDLGGNASLWEHRVSRKVRLRSEQKGLR